MQAVRLTIREVAESIKRQYGGSQIPDWKVRRVVDSLDASGTLNVQRVASYRTVSGDDVGIIAAELQRLGRLPKKEHASC